MTTAGKFANSSKAPLSLAAFTLVEVLVVMIIIGLMSAMVLTATSGVNRSAREARTRSIVAAVDRVIQEKYESLRYRPLPVEIPSLFTDPTIVRDDTEIGYEVLADEAARVRLIMLRDLMRMELPDHFADITQAPATIQAACSKIAVRNVGGTPTVVGLRADLNERRSFPVSWPTGVSASRLAMLNRIMPPPLTSITPSLDHQSSECLYMIMSTTFIAGSPAIDAIPTSNIGDTDGDGFPEILDGWGRPLGFVRWPVGYQDSQVVDYAVADDFDLYTSDFAYGIPVASSFSASSTRLAVNISAGTSVNPWSLRPLVLSAGEDGEFGVALNPMDASGTVLTGFNHLSTASGADWRWPINAANMGDQAQGRANPSIASIHYPDPYLRRFISQNDASTINRTLGSGSYTTQRRLPGEDLAPDGEYPDDISDPRKADNITNYSLQATE